MSESAGTMKGRIALVTGATQGIGRETALGLAKQGARVAIVGRDAKRTEEAAAYVRAGAPGAEVDVFVADLSLLAEVRRLAAEVKARLPKLHVLVNNAGAIFMERGVTSEGLERTFALNHLGYFLLTHELQDLLVQSAPARVINVASEAHRRARFALDDLQSERNYSGILAYGASKLMNILFTRELARRLAGKGVTANSLHPGVIRSGFGSNNGAFSLLWKVGGLFMLSAEKGARTTLHLAISDEGGRASGLYFKNEKPKRPSRLAEDDGLAKGLWEKSLQLVKA